MPAFVLYGLVYISSFVLCVILVLPFVFVLAKCFPTIREADVDIEFIFNIHAIATFLVFLFVLGALYGDEITFDRLIGQRHQFLSRNPEPNPVTMFFWNFDTGLAFITIIGFAFTLIHQSAFLGP